ncbi:MAG: radical SAM protein [Thermoleophilia bacterium]|nr:radical SAM protein [Thermoleophilia bacterium]MDH3755839.1 radical SAM protein [Acidimicrobiia bacterium]
MSTPIDRPTAPHAALDFDRTPLLAIWETTQACGLACRHCRADARDWHSPDELTTQEGCDLISRVADMGTTVMVLSGGDPLRRDDLEDLIAHGTSVGVRMCTIPAVTERLTVDRMRSLRAAGVAKLAFSIDGATAESHDGMRQVPGTFDRSVERIRQARELGIDVQINTLVCASNVDELDEIARIAESLGADMWELMFLIPVGRGALLPELGPEECERAFGIIDAIERRVDFVVKATEAPHYRRYRREHGYEGHLHRVNAGKGFVFIAHDGDIYPSGFLPLTAGNVREDDIVDVYRSSDIMRALRDPDRLAEPCRSCDWHDTCGGSRSRSYGLTGDPFAAEPWCTRVAEYETADPTPATAGT